MYSWSVLEQFFLVIKKATNNHFVYYWSGVCCYGFLCLSSALAAKDIEGFWFWSKWWHNSLLWQQHNYWTFKESCVTWLKKQRDVRFHFLHELTKDGVIKPIHCHNQEQIADIMTKSMKLDVFVKLRGLLGVCMDPSINWIQVVFSLRKDIEVAFLI